MDFSGSTVLQMLDYARIAEAAERYEDMCQAMKLLVEQKLKSKEALEVEERNLLSVAYKNVVGNKRSSWRSLNAGSFPDVKPELVDGYQKTVESELKKICDEVVELLEKLCAFADSKKDDVPSDGKGNGETRVFYYKMQGDYYRYLSEFISDEESLKGYKEKTKDSYSKAMEVAKIDLAETHPTRLGLALNYSVCHYEILKDPKEACKLAKEAFDAAIEKLDTLNDASYKDSTLIMQLLRDNLTLWTSESESANPAGPDNP